MAQPFLPCPHCAEPIAYRWRDDGPGRGAVDGICVACLKPYRFGAGARIARALAWIAVALLAAAIYALLQRCAACERWASQPLFALTPVLLVATALLGGLVAGALGVRLHVARCRQRGHCAEVLEAVDEDVEPVGGRTRTHPAAALLAATALLVMLAWAVVAELQAMRTPTPPSAAPAIAADDAMAFWFPLVLDALLLALVLGCAIVVARRALARRAVHAGSRATPD
jgi:hypothetical protein